MSLKGFALICSLGAFGFRTVSYFHCRLCREVLSSTEVNAKHEFRHRYCYVKAFSAAVFSVVSLISPSERKGVYLCPTEKNMAETTYAEIGNFVRVQLWLSSFKGVP